MSDLTELALEWMDHREYGLAAFMAGSTFIITKSDVVFTFKRTKTGWKIYGNGELVEKWQRVTYEAQLPRARRGVKAPPAP